MKDLLVQKGVGQMPKTEPETDHVQNRLFTTDNGWRLATLFCTILFTVSATVWSVRSYLANHDQVIIQKFVDLENALNTKIANNREFYETEINKDRQAMASRDMELADLHIKVDKDIVPRTEQQTHWDEQKQFHDDIKHDNDELRQDVRDLTSRIDKLTTTLHDPPTDTR